MKNKRPSHIEEFAGFMAGALAYDQRSAVIVITAKLDSLLYAVVKKVTFPSLREEDELLDGEAPLSSFSAKITFVHRLGKIDLELAKTLHLIRKIRNDFAHKTDSCGLDLSPHADRIREIVRYYEGYRQEYTEYRKRFSGVLNVHGSPLVQDFFTVSGIVIQTLMEAVRRSETWRSKDVPHMTLIPYGWRSKRLLAKWREEWDFKHAARR